MTNLGARLPRAPRRGLRHRAARGRRPPGLGRRHAQVPAPDRRRPRGRDRLHPRGGPRHALRLEPGRLHPDLLLLPHRHPAAGAQPDRGRDRRPDPRRPRRPRRLGAQARREAAGLEPGADGDGRAALQLRGGARRHEGRDGRRGHRAVAPADHPLDLRGGARDRPRRRRRSAACSRSRSTPPPTRCATGWCRSTANGRSRRCSTPAAPTRGCRTPSASPSST